MPLLSNKLANHTDRHLFHDSSCNKSSPNNAWSVLDKSPMLFSTGAGRVRKIAGVEMMLCSLANRGFLLRSTTSISYSSGICSSQIFRNRTNAVSDSIVGLAMYTENL